jgi:hypothetical protein
MRQELHHILRYLSQQVEQRKHPVILQGDDLCIGYQLQAKTLTMSREKMRVVTCTNANNNEERKLNRQAMVCSIFFPSSHTSHY